MSIKSFIQSIASMIGIGDKGQPVDKVVPVDPYSTKKINTNGKHDVRNYQFAEVDVRPSIESLAIDANGDYNVENCRTVQVNVPRYMGDNSFNIHYGNTAPTDTSKLWVKGDEPWKVIIDSVPVESNTIEANIAKLPISAIAMGTATVNSKIYIFGGSDWGTFVDTIIEFDTKTNTRVILDTKLEYPCCGVACATVGDYIYIAGGAIRERNTTVGIDNIYKFNTKTKAMEKIDAKLPVECSGMLVGVIGTDIYYIGGVDSDRKKLKTICWLDTKTDTLSTLAITMPESVENAQCATIDDIIYVINNDKIYTVDVNGDKIEQLPVKINNPVSNFGCVAYGDEIYIIGGLVGLNSSNEIYIFNTQDNTIRKLNQTLPTTLQDFGCEVVGSKIYIISGASRAFYSGIYFDDIHVIRVDSELAEDFIYIHTSHNGNNVWIIDNNIASVNIAIDGVYRGDKNNTAKPEEAYIYDNNTWRSINYGG